MAAIVNLTFNLQAKPLENTQTGLPRQLMTDYRASAFEHSMAASRRASQAEKNQ